MDEATKQRIERAAQELESALSAYGRPGVVLQLRATDVTTIRDEGRRLAYEIRIDVEHTERIR